MSNELEQTKNNGLPLVSMISVFYNRGYCVKESVQSMLDQTYPNLEIILVDDESTDNTLEELKKFELDPRVKVITHPNMGFTKSIKKACEEYSSGEYLAVHGAGDISKKDRIALQVELLETNHKLAFCATRHVLVDDEGKKYKNTLFSGVVENADIQKKLFWTHGSVIYRKKDYMESGGYHPEMKYCQDWHLYLRLTATQFAWVVDDVLYEKVIFDDGASFKPSKKIDQLVYAELARLGAGKVDNDLKNQVFIDNKYIFFKNILASYVDLVNKGKKDLALEWLPIVRERFGLFAWLFLKAVVVIK